MQNDLGVFALAVYPSTVSAVSILSGSGYTTEQAQRFVQAHGRVSGSNHLWLKLTPQNLNLDQITNVSQLAATYQVRELACALFSCIDGDILTILKMIHSTAGEVPPEMWSVEVPRLRFNWRRISHPYDPFVTLQYAKNISVEDAIG